MARTDTLNNYLTDIATVIKAKNDDETPINASKFDEEINKLVRDDYYIDGELSKEIDTNYFINRLIIRIPIVDTSRVANFSYAFQRCSNLVELQELDGGDMINVSQAFASCGSLVIFGGLKDLGKAYLTTATANYANYTLNLSNTILNLQSLINVIDGVYDIASLGIQPQTIVFGSKLLAILEESEEGRQALARLALKGWNAS